MKTLCFLALAALVGAVLSSNARAANIGDPAPPLPIERWIKGTPVRVGAGANLFVVESGRPGAARANAAFRTSPNCKRNSLARVWSSLASVMNRCPTCNPS